MALLRSGARQLLESTEWQAERVFHVGRLIMWIGLIVLQQVVWGVSFGNVIVSSLGWLIGSATGRAPQWQFIPGSPLDWAASVFTVLVGTTIWSVYWWVLHHRTWWKVLRFPAAFADVLGVVRFAAALRGAELAGHGAGLGLTADRLAGLTPALFVLIILSGAFRLDPLIAVFIGVISLAGQVTVSLIVGRTLSSGLFELCLLWLTMFLGAQMVFVLRGLALKAAEEDVLERFVPQGLTQHLARAGGHVPARVVPVTILIADIRGFTALSEPLGPAQAVALLNDFFATVVGPLVAEEAVLDKYLGDGLLAFVEGEGHASRGLRAARAIVAAIVAGNARREHPLRMGIAVHSATAFVGSIGAPARMEYTIIGDAVNVTSRLEGLMSSKAGAERINAALVASSDTITQATECGTACDDLEGPLQVSVHGRTQPLDVYYLPSPF